MSGWGGGKRRRRANSRTGTVISAAITVAPRQPDPSPMTPTRRRGPTMPPTEPATTHLAMFRSVDAGSRSIHVAWARLTNAPDAGNSNRSRPTGEPKPGAAAVPNSARMNVTPPPSTTPAAPSDVGEEGEARLDERAEDPGDRQQEPDLDVGERELPTDEWPRSFPKAEHQLVHELDREEDRDRGEGSWRRGQPKGRGTRMIRRLPHARTRYGRMAAHGSAEG